MAIKRLPHKKSSGPERNQRARVSLVGKGFEFDCPLGNGPALITGGGAEYEGGKRPQADAVTLFMGNGLLTMDVPVLFDGWPETSIQAHVDQILALCRGVGRKQPPHFKATGPIPYSGSRWQMQMPEWGETLRSSKSGVLVRQALTLKLIEWNDPTAIDYRNRGGEAGRRGNPTEAELTSIVLPNEMTLMEAAAKYLGSADQAQALGKLNGISDLRKKLKAGTRLKLGTEANLFPAQKA